MSLTDAELERYARHIVLKEVGGVGQQALRRATVAVIGAGGIGSPAIQYLAAAGVGRLIVIDDDSVDLLQDDVARIALQFATASDSKCPGWRRWWRGAEESVAAGMGLGVGAGEADDEAGDCTTRPSDS